MLSKFCLVQFWILANEKIKQKQVALNSVKK